MLARQPPDVFAIRQALDGQIELRKASCVEELGQELLQAVIVQSLGQALLQQELLEVEASIDLLYGRPN